MKLNELIKCYNSNSLTEEELNKIELDNYLDELKYIKNKKINKDTEEDNLKYVKQR